MKRSWVGELLSVVIIGSNYIKNEKKSKFNNRIEKNVL